MNRLELIALNQRRILIGKSPLGYGFTHFAARDFKEGEVVMSGFGKVIDHQTSHISIQIDSDRHCLPTKWTGRYWNHSCEPNTYARTRSDRFPDLVALRDIGENEEINYAYWTTEYAWSDSADETTTECLCGAKRCRGKILSFSELPKRVRDQIAKDRKCSEYLYAKF